jgi:lysozyme
MATLHPTQALRDQLIRDEGRVLHAYQDHLGFWTIGVGRLIDGRKNGGITEEEAAYLLDNDIRRKTKSLAEALPWYLALDEARRGCLENMAFQMGVDGLLKFKTTLRLVQSGDYKAAARQMLKSLWARQTPERAARVARQMEIGVWQ